MSLLLFRSQATGQGKTITAGVITLSLSAVGAEVSSSKTITAGVITVSLRPETAAVATTAVTAAAAQPSAAELFAAAIETSHAPRVRLTTYFSAGTVRATYDPNDVVLSGTVTYDRNRNIRRFGSFTLVDQTGALAPQRAGDAFSPGERLRLDRGVVVSGQTIYQPLGRYEVARFGSTMAGTLNVSIEDPTYALNQELGEVVVVRAGTSAAAVLRTLWEPVLGDGSGWDLDDDGMTVEAVRTYAEDDDRLTSVLDLMADLGLEVFTDRRGQPVLRPITDPNDASVSHTWEQAPGKARAISLDRSSDWRPYNRQVVIGEPTDRKPIRAVADITDTRSPLHANRIGLRVAPIYRSAQVATQHQANTVARTRLMEQSMWADTVIWTGVPDPTVEAGDVIRLIEPQTGTDARYRVDQVTTPLGMGTTNMTASLVVPLFD